MYIKLKLDDEIVVYQQINENSVVQYLDQNGNYLYDTIPVGIGSTIMDANPPTETWMS